MDIFADSNMGISAHTDIRIKYKHKIIFRHDDSGRRYVSDANKVVTDFFNILNNPQKVSCNVLVDSDVRIVEVDGKDVVCISVPEASYRNKPIYR